jgi:AmiR/NasT family two-component response regulator
VAMGVLMHRHRVTREQAFDLLRLASQESGTPLSDVATAVADAGDLTGLAPPLGTALDEADPATS